jgi:small-conductance mechanosensitive channel
MELTSFDNVFSEIGAFFTEPLFTFSGTDYTVLSLLGVVFSIFLVFFISGKIRNLLENRILPKYSQETNFNSTVATLTRYVMVVVGLMIVFQSAGINLSSLNVLAGAVGVGIGFGLQNIANNFISGLIILFERPIKVGDRIEVGELVGNVEAISARATIINTNDNISVIVPNSQFTDNQVINWSYHNSVVRFRFSVGVSYNEDPEVIKTLLLEVANDNKGILKDPPPDVLFDEFGDSSLNFSLAVWTKDYINRPVVLKSELYYAIFAKFKEHGIEIPFPQRDLHLKSGFEQISEASKIS